MDNRPIGVFDSGLGGLTVAKEIMQELPNESIIYFGDSGRVPYGSRSKDTILKYTLGDMRFLRTFDVKMIVIACGTASSVYMLMDHKPSEVPVVGVIDATSYAAVRATKNKKIGIIGTVGTVKSGSYEKIIHNYDPEIETVTKACPLFVPLVEEGHFDTPVARLVIEEYLTPIKESGADTLILGCTHYPHLKKAIQAFLGDNVTLIDPGQEVAQYLKKKFTNNDMRHDDKRDEEQYKYYVSDNIESFGELGSRFLERKINGQVGMIDIEKY